MPLLTAAMMVKNEERHLERCLSSLKSLFPEIIIVDTGSTDRTVEIARRFTKHVYEQPWRDDFSFHRNESFSHATGDWIMQIDADEEIVWADREKGPAEFADFLRRIPDGTNAIFLALRDWRESLKLFSGEMDSPRIFRRGTVKYRRRVHNDPVFPGEATVYRGFYLKHYGYDLADDQKKAKANRTIPLLLESLQDDPDDHECYFYLMNAYEAWLGDTASAIDAGREYIDRQEKLGNAFNQTVYHSLAGMFIRQKKFSDAKDMINQGLAKWRENPDLWFDTLRISVAEGDGLAVSRAAQNYIHSARQLMAARGKKGGMFFFHLDPDSIATGLFYLVGAHFEIGANELANLKNIIKLCLPETKKSVEEKMAGLFKALGIEDTTERRMIVVP